MKYVLTISFFLGIISSLSAQNEKRASFYKDNENQIREIYHLSGTGDNILHGEYISFYMNGKMEKKGNYEAGFAQGKWEYYYENGKRKMQGELDAGEPHGFWIYYFENGGKKMEGKMIGERREGDWLIYYQNGAIKRRGAFVDGMRKGLWFYYYEDERLKGKIDFFENRGKYTAYYRSGNIRAKGLKFGTRNHGKWTYYYENGVRMAEGHYTNGKKSGEWNYFHYNEQTSSVGKYLKGEATGEWKYYHANGELQSSGTFDEGKKHGKWSLFSDNGKLKGKGIFAQGSGIYSEYHDNGKLKVKGLMNNGVNQGKWHYYYPTGQLEGECEYVNGKGQYKGYYQDGLLKIKGIIERDKKTGIWELYDNSGALSGLYKPYYEKDSPPELLISGPVIRRDYGVADYKFRTSGFRYFDSKINEFIGVIVGGNPAFPLLGSFPVSLEFYMQERLGHELEFILIRNPFFKQGFRVSMDDLYKRGYTIAFKQKFYNLDDKFGMWYFGHGLYFTNMTHFFNIRNSNSRVVCTTGSKEHKFEYGAILGYRLKVRTRQAGFTIDAHIGMAVGYRDFSLSKIQPKAFESLDQRAFSNTFRARLNLGYVFGTGKTGRK